MKSGFTGLWLTPFSLLTYRIYPSRTGDRLAVLHASASTDLLGAVQCVMSPGCRGRHSGSTIQPIHNLRSRAGHGDGSLHDFLSAGLSGIRLPQMEYRLPGLDQPRSRKPLHPHVRDLDHGFVRPEPQEGRL